LTHPKNTTFPNRHNQRQILETLLQSYPASVDVQGWDYPNLSAELKYLHEHNLAEVRFSQSISADAPQPIFAKLTARGVDFLQQDGGLSAILGVLTIKLHDDTIKEVIASRIMESDLPQPDKQRYIDALRELPAESTKHVVMKLLDMGLDHGATAISTIGKMLGIG